MYSLLVLGIIPGTSIQITFQTWLNAAGIFLAAVILWRSFRLAQYGAQTVPVRQPLHATQLHRRG
jgi:hypothetical protein